MENIIDQFCRESGFKVLAMARLSQVEYSVVLYLINCAASNLKEVITTERELSSLIGYDEKEIRTAIDHLASRYIVRARYGTPNLKRPDKESLRIGLQFDLSQWLLDFKTEASAKDAVVFPFRRVGHSHLQVLSNKSEKSEEQDRKNAATYARILDAFACERELSEAELASNTAAAKVLVETHHVDLVLLMIRHFKARIPTLSLLASSWQHFQELFEEETQKIDILEARQKHEDLDEALRQAAQALRDDEEKYSACNEEEKTVIDILLKHLHPRRQLFWAYQMRSRYPNLANFFAENSSLMLGVTTSGKILPRKD